MIDAQLHRGPDDGGSTVISIGDRAVGPAGIDKVRDSPSRARQSSLVTIVGSCRARVLASRTAFSAVRSCRCGVELTGL